jgi:hypothetical protein
VRSARQMDDPMRRAQDVSGSIRRQVPNLDIARLSATMNLNVNLRCEVYATTIEIRDANLEARLKKQLQATGSTTVEEVLLHLLETQEEQDRWLSENREAINAKIRRGIEQLDRGEGIPEDRLDVHLARLKDKPE